MSCPHPTFEPDTFGELDANAREHLGECAECRARAVAADPLRAFQLLPDPRFASDEVATMQARVRASLRASELQTNVWAHAERRNRMRYAAAAAGLAATLGLLTLQGGTPANESWQVADELPAEWPGDEAALLRELARLPVLEAGDGVAMSGDERAAVMVISSLDV